jgi:hypothetical protein
MINKAARKYVCTYIVQAGSKNTYVCMYLYTYVCTYICFVQCVYGCGQRMRCHLHYHAEKQNMCTQYVVNMQLKYISLMYISGLLISVMLPLDSNTTPEISGTRIAKMKRLAAPDTRCCPLIDACPHLFISKLSSCAGTYTKMYSCAYVHMYVAPIVRQCSYVM